MITPGLCPDPAKQHRKTPAQPRFLLPPTLPSGAPRPETTPRPPDRRLPRIAQCFPNALFVFPAQAGTHACNGTGPFQCYEKSGWIWRKCRTPDGVCSPRESMCEAITVAVREAGRARFGPSGLQDPLLPWPLGNVAARNGMAARPPNSAVPRGYCQRQVWGNSTRPSAIAGRPNRADSGSSRGLMVAHDPALAVHF